MNKRVWIIIGVIAILLIGGAAYFLMNQPSNTNPYNQNTGTPETNPPATTPETNPPATGETGPKTYTADISGFSFSPKELTIKTGDTVIWTNKDSFPHTVTSDSGTELDSPRMSNGGTFSHTFNTAGTYPYHCAIHTGMKAKIIVE